MTFLEYFKPTKRTLSLTAIIFLSQFIVFMANVVLISILFPEYLTATASAENMSFRAPDALLIGGVFVGFYIASCTSEWWLEEYLNR